MADKLKEQQEVKPGVTEDGVKYDGGVYETCTVYATATAPHHKDGEKIFCSKAVGDKMIANGWAIASPASSKK